MVIQRRFIRLIRVLSVLLNLLGVWVLGISKSSKMPCWLNRCGLFITKTLYFIEYLVLSFFLKRLHFGGSCSSKVLSCVAEYLAGS